jgi:hypothetical protein
MRVMGGKSLREIAQSYNCNYSPLREFIREDDERESAYQEVLEKKKQDHSEELIDRTARAAFATVQDALTGDGGTLDIAQWPTPLLAACDTAEFGPTGQIYKIKMDAGKHQDRLGRMLGMDKSGQTNLNIASLVNVLAEMPAGAIRQRPGAQPIEDATYVKPELPAPTAKPDPERTLERV